MLTQRRPRLHCASHLDFIRSLPCIVCGNDIETQAAHLAMADARADKRYVGMAEKADDTWTLPLCGGCHAKQHGIGEKRFWDFGVIDPVFVCLALWRVTGDYAAGCRIVQHWRVQ